ncbi:VWA domain-containing protein [Aquisphaera insulae]|uniref:VWA domain-containing protein n=1 Tax=Aquisphaera insulae TaxID=2712864 RepID=UPI0013EDB00E|nr:VWA domain-containing protein [Aquisphaera insulae]
MDWLLRRLADALDVAPPAAGEAISPHLRFDRPWPQWMLIAVVAGGAALIIWLYRREGRASAAYKAMLATIRIVLMLMLVLMIAETVLSVERTGLPYLTIMVDDSASDAIADQYDDPDAREALESLAGRAASALSDGPDKAPTAASTSAPGAAREPSRLDVAKGLILRDQARLIRELQKQHKVRLYLVSNSARPLAEVDGEAEIAPAVEKLRKIEATGSQSRLGDGARQVLTELRGAPPSAIILLSDGQTTEGEPLAKAAELAARKGVPIFPIGLGNSEPNRDLELTELLVDDVVFVDDAVRFQAKLLSRGFAGKKVRLSLKERDPTSTDPTSAREIESTEVEVPPDGQPRRVELVHHPKATGERTYILEIDRQPRELQAENNRIERPVTVRKEKLRILFVESEPRFEFRYLKNFLEREETIDLNVVLLSSDPEYNEQDRSAIPTFPAAKDELFAYDVILVGDADPSFLSTSQMQNMFEFVSEKGGGILFVAGDAFNPLSYRGTPLETLLPIELNDARNPSAQGLAIASFRPELTAEGRSSPIYRFGATEAASAQIWQALPELYWYFEAPRKKPAAMVLAEHPGVVGSEGKIPLDLYQFSGAGKSMFHAFDDTWRWRFRSGDRYFGRFWVQAIRFLARSKLAGQRKAEVETDRRRYDRGQPIQIRVRFPNPALVPPGGVVTVQVERNRVITRKLSLGPVAGNKNVFEGALPQVAEGEYQVRLTEPILDGPLPTTSFRVDTPASELERTQMNEPELRKVAAATGGKFYTPLTADTLLQDLPSPAKVPLDTDPPRELWNTWPVLGLFLGLLALEWVLRKRRQMV